VKVGAQYLGSDRCEFTVWAPLVETMEVKIVAPTSKLLPMQQIESGYWKVIATEIVPGTQYLYRLNGGIERPDPASYFQSQGVHHASEVVNHQSFNWTDQNWEGIPQSEMVIYELHVGTFTSEGTLEAIIPRLAQLKELGINAIELMPIAQFPGERNWGYDGVYPYAVQNSYGGPKGLKKLVDACHSQGFAVFLDTVYNHFGPEGSYVSDFAPYYTDAYKSPWGLAINFDEAYSYGVRNYFIKNALYWFEQYHIDALRLDASDRIYDFGTKHFLRELVEATDALSTKLGRKFCLVGENDLSDVRVVSSPEVGGYGLDGQWNDAFHHCLRTLLTGEKTGYYQDYGTCEQLAKAFKQGFVYSWEFSPFRNRWHGSDSSQVAGDRFVVFAQNHDQVGNRVLGDRLTQVVSFEALKLAAAAVLMAPNIPLIFMGEEYAEEAPFLYFVSHSDPELIEAVRQGRKKEFQAFHLENEYADPENAETFERSRLKWDLWQSGKYQVMREWYQHLIQLRRTTSALQHLNKQNLEVQVVEEDKLLFLQRWHEKSNIFSVMNFNQSDVIFKSPVQGSWRRILDSAEEKWTGSGSLLPEQLLVTEQDLTIRAQSVALYQQ
jgi:maltooligosyltrehalose trehalohydrolase